MNISANTNQIADTQAINRILYNYAIKDSAPVSKAPEVRELAREDDIKLAGDDIFKNIDVDDIKKSAQSIGEDISEEDIKYGLTYGRSVLADYSA